jgi:hypothetical protein
MYRNLTAEEKGKYEQLAQKDKARYLRQMDEYKASKTGGDAKDKEKSDSDSEGLNDVVDDDDDDDISDED